MPRLRNPIQYVFRRFSDCDAICKFRNGDGSLTLYRMGKEPDFNFWGSVRIFGDLCPPSRNLQLTKEQYEELLTIIETTERDSVYRINHPILEQIDGDGPGYADS